MDDLLNIFAKVEAYNGKLDETYESLMVQMRELLLGQSAPSVAAAAANPAIANVSKDDASTASPQQTKKRLKCLSLLEENESEEAASQAMELGTPVKPLRASNAKLLNIAEELNEQHMAPPPAAKAQLPAPRNGKTPNETREQEKECVNSNETETNLMPPPPAPTSNSVQTPQNPPEEQSFSRPQRAAKSKVEKSLREPKLNSKLRRPTNSEEVVVKLEHKQRASQMSDANTRAASKSSISSETSTNKAEESIIVVPGKATSVVVLDSDDDSSKVDNQTNKDVEKEPMRQLRVKIKREKASMSNEEQNVPPKEKENSELNIQEPAPVVPTITTTADIADATFKAPESVLPPKAHIPLVAIKTEVTTDESTMSSTLLSATTTNSTITSKKGRKKKEPHRPIKVERFSDIDKASPISSRTRKGTNETAVDNNAGEQQQKTRAGTLYEDAIDSAPTASNTATPPSRLSQVPSEVLAAAASNAAASATFCNQTMTVSNATMNMGSAPADATYLANATFKTSSNNQNPDATVTLNKNSGAGLSDVTFDVQGNANNTTESTSTKHSMVTAQEHDSLITEDESFEQRAAQTAAMPAPKLVKPKAPVPGKSLTAAAKAAYKMPSRNELFNPLVQSPVKMRVEAFEHAASAAAENTKNTRPKRTKENMTPNQSGVGSYTTPTIGKLKAPALGRFLTPTQTSNVPTSASIAAAKKAPSSASKAMAYPKTTVTTTTKPLSRENSGDDFRKGLHLISEERKKQREQKHLLAAQQREAKERERAERIQKLAKEREEKRLKKQMEAEQKKREIEEIQRKLRQQEEAAQAAEAAKIKAAKDREMLMQMKQQQLLLAQQNAAKPKFVMPPPPKPTSKYTFAMLHEDDSTDDEGKTSYKRPPPPTWSRSHVRGEAITRQQYAPTAIIDSFFSVQPTTPDLKLIFPNIDARYLKRNSSALWSTPPRYSELPKY